MRSFLFVFSLNVGSNNFVVPFAAVLCVLCGWTLSIDAAFIGILGLVPFLGQQAFTQERNLKLFVFSADVTG